MDHSWIGMPTTLDMAIQGILTAAMFEWIRRRNLRKEDLRESSDEEPVLLSIQSVDENPYASPIDLPDRKAA